jgi:cysteine desulfurase
MRVHLDHNATTPLRPEARERWLAVADALRGNPSSLHAGGRAARAVVDEAREEVAGALGASEDEIVFTSGGTEANNLALRGSVAAGTLVTSAAEHSSVLEAVRALGAEGVPVRVIGVDRAGFPDGDALAEALGEGSTGLVSIMAANNEVGSVPDLRRLRGVLEGVSGGPPRFHTDAVQALGRIPVDLAGWGVDLASFSAHKVGGPPGSGVLWRRRGTGLEPLLFGGGQEGGLRPGTEDVAGIAASARAIALAVREQPELERRLRELTRELAADLANAVPNLELIGPSLAPDEAERHLPNTLCIRVPDADGRVLVTRLDLAGLEVSAGSACASGSVEPSHVLLAMGYDEDAARSGLRLSLGRNTSREECKHAVRVLEKLFAASRAS